jgi:putative redox protein
MAEKVIVRQNNNFQIEFQAVDPHDPDSDDFQSVEEIHSLTPYGMLLASLGSCTAIVMHTYAQHHGLDLQEAELTLEYERIFEEDCENCEEIDEYKEQIEERISLTGELTSAERDRLLHIAHQCPIYKMLQSGMELTSVLEPG